MPDTPVMLALLVRPAAFRLQGCGAPHAADIRRFAQTRPTKWSPGWMMPAMFAPLSFSTARCWTVLCLTRRSNCGVMCGTLDLDAVTSVAEKDKPATAGNQLRSSASAILRKTLLTSFGGFSFALLQRDRTRQAVQAEPQSSAIASIRVD
jgi:hypothetical protein